MNTLKKYKEDAKQLFYLSVNKDIDKWKGGTSSFDNYNSPEYNGSSFKILRGGAPFAINSLWVKTPDNDTKICTYFWGIFPIDLKVSWYVRKLTRKFKQKQRDKENEQQINNIKNGIEKMQTSFIKEIRKEKLEKIEEN